MVVYMQNIEYSKKNEYAELLESPRWALQMQHMSREFLYKLLLQQKSGNNFSAIIMAHSNHCCKQRFCPRDVSRKAAINPSWKREQISYFFLQSFRKRHNLNPVMTKLSLSFLFFG
ncbi:hypothetical protein CRENBAI_019701 [Crenichthys baileyi]|uniref:Uncharacterized protein n=1 Tax=Crenichthys baileyi TaxID=28760 RepID=A0AAV9QXC7_9TELE